MSLFDAVARALDQITNSLGLPVFIVVIGGGLFFLVYSGFIPFRYYGRAIKSLRKKDDDAPGQISSAQALATAIASTVGMGNISGVAVALSMGGPGAIFWMWVSACVGMATKFFEGTLAIMYKGKDGAGEVQGGAMYMITEGLGKKWKPLAILFSLFGLVGTLCLWQANQLTEAITTVCFVPAGFENSIWLRLLVGGVICLMVSAVVLGGITRISAAATRIVPGMVLLYFGIVAYILATHLGAIPDAFAAIVQGAFNFKAGVGGLAGTAVIIGARRATLVNEAGVGTASMMHGASKNTQPAREGLVAMIAPSIDSGLVCTLTALAILIGMPGHLIQDAHVQGSADGIRLAMESFKASIPMIGHYLLLAVAFIFAFSTMFSYSYYGTKCTNFLFGAKRAPLYNYFFLAMLVVGAVIPLATVVAIVDIAYAMMAFCTMFTMFVLAPKAKKEMKRYFAK